MRFDFWVLLQFATVVHGDSPNHIVLLYVLQQVFAVITLHSKFVQIFFCLRSKFFVIFATHQSQLAPFSLQTWLIDVLKIFQDAFEAFFADETMRQKSRNVKKNKFEHLVSQLAMSLVLRCDYR
jgi:hypothetical protein